MRHQLLNCRRRMIVAMVFALLAFVSTGRTETHGDEVTVLTALPATYSVASALTRGTAIHVLNIPDEGRRMQALARFLEKPDDAVLQRFRTADAVITIGKLWQEDPLYSAVRDQNIRVVNIDATAPYSSTRPGIAVIQEPMTGAPWEEHGETAAARRGSSIYFWLSLSNAARMVDIVAHDLTQLCPRDTARIGRNASDYRRQLFELKRTYEARFAQLENVSIFALSADFVYLTGDMGLFVDGYFTKQDIDWTPEDLRKLGKHLADNAVRVVIHKWEPNAQIREAIRAAGASLVVLQTAEDAAGQGGRITEEIYLIQLKANLEALHAALVAAKGP